MTRSALLLASLLLLRGGSATSDAEHDVTVWAWERPEDLTFLPPDVSVAYLYETLTIDGGGLRVAPRRAPLHVSRGARVVPVLRVEWVRGTSIDPSPPLRQAIVARFAAAVAQTAASEAQVDFDAPPSLHDFYRELLSDLRSGLPRGTRLSMTSLASYCAGDPSWIDEASASVDEVVPMVFSMGRSGPRVLSELAVRGGWSSRACDAAVGLAVGERAPRVAPAAHVYLFDRRPWTPDDYERAKAAIRGSHAS